ncbi:MAG: ABC transporter substrate-binding protein [Candidatus Spechtbacterales bacterium]|nr:ABC transporter substrate-binding protein [Candidatus Spechtbacterales bacterium]
MKIPKNNPIKPLFTLVKRVFQRFGPHEKYIVGLFAFVVLVSLIALGLQFYINQTEIVPTYGGEYREAVIGLPRFINPALSITSDVDRDLSSLVYSSLVKYDKNGEIQPDLAESYEVLQDGKQYKFTLRENLSWEDDTPLTAEDVVFTIELIQDPQYSSPLFQAWQGVDVSVENERTIVFSLPSAYPPFLENATLGILPKHIWQDVTTKNFALTDLNIQPVGSGPYKVEKFTKNNDGFISSYTLEKNDNYHGKEPYINKLTFRFYDSERNAIRAYNAKNVDGVAFVSFTNISDLKNESALNLHTFNMPRYFAIFINQDNNELLEDKTVRQSIAHATNKQEIINEVLSGYGRVADTPIPPTLEEYHNQDVENIPHNPEQARLLLEQAGWAHLDDDGILERQIEGAEEGTHEELSFTLITANTPELTHVADLLAKQWKTVGIQLNVVAQELGELQQDTIKSRSYELLMFGQILGSIPDPFSFWHSTQVNDPGLNLANYSNEDVDDLLETGRQEINKEERITAYNEFQKLVANDIPAIFLYDPLYLYPVNDRIKGIDSAFIVDTSHRFVDVENWYIETNRVFK